MPASVSFVELVVPPRVPRQGTVDGRPRLTIGPPSLTGMVAVSSVPSQRAVGLPRLLIATQAQPRSVASAARVGMPAAQAGVTVVVKPKGRATRRAVGRPAVTSIGPGVAWVVYAKGLGRRNA